MQEVQRRCAVSGGEVWALVLAAGEGTRLRSLTTTDGGLTVPKQFCSLRGGASLVEDALARAESVADRERIVAVVAAQHRRWWEAPLRTLAPSNITVQPENKGTAAGLLLPLLHIMARDPLATIIVLPSDHFVRNERILARSLRQGVGFACADERSVYLLGIVPEEADPELGYIVPGDRTPFAAAPVRRFVEKPAREAARGLIDGGALWNAFILAARARALFGLYAARQPQLTASLAAAVAKDRAGPQHAPAAQRLYPTLPTLDFSRDVLEGQESTLRVLTAPACGWSDLGTPQRVAATLDRHSVRSAAARGSQHAARGSTSYLNLADQHARRTRTAAPASHP